ncbi:(p)ppGpp synthetase I SpoT RelA [Apilactobacillus ozensis DSM 23829 = JCM 17196]|uniref:GTP diphosphokinase n=1 Tax=Apilactobacillus ozensis DSM 23829 = JCM 17196 TaxID=1423781 RepID=A0A0R2AVC7_9LACO|nr:bifunctional (p)ppGpp synthetase/guanosine-3',5'-bis(diphosphate) 3'-pyrophosphohydrolase [Apilactobacillus ozensis]KRM67833.1 (p)ppGpp synthetase I SpoT RelA [Apilactobacillus ozensis DSM 23829 = JCM 17196]
MSKHEEWSSVDVFDQASKYMNQKQLSLVKKAYEFAKICHDGQKRQSGEAYIIHPIQVASILVSLKMDAETISAGFLHDVVEDTGANLSDIKELFGDNIGLIVDGVTKLGKIKYKSNQEQLAENHRKLLLAMCQDIRVMIVKLADRLHNMRTLGHLRPEKQRRIANETLEIYAPLADRLGIGTIKWELEDISLRYLNPQQYYRIVHLMNSKRNQREEYIQIAIKDVKKSIKSLNMSNVEIYGRPKHIYSVYKKMKDKHKQFSEIYDLLAVRVIVDSIKDCYGILGAIHAQWPPMPRRFKDYIAMPKANMYQSLHTTVIGPEGRPLEAQIRTHKMQQVAEYGVAAHWAYKEGVRDEVKSSNDNNRLNWFKRIIELQEDTDNASDFMTSVKGELFGDHVYAFTPKGDVLELPKGAGPLDLAYLIHTDVGNKTTGARVNGKIVPLDYKIKNGDIVSIMTSTNSAGPSEDWIHLVSTSRARHKIKQFFKKRDRDKNILNGHETLNKLIKENGYDVKAVLEKDNLNKVLNAMKFHHIDDLYAAIGFGDVQPQSVVNNLTSDIRNAEEKEKQAREQKELLENHQTISPEENDKFKNISSTSEGVIIKGVDNLLLRLSHCCSPIPGDKIVGYITKGRGVSVHRYDCPNIKKAEDSGERLINVSWADNLENKNIYEAMIEVQGYNRGGFLNDVIKTVNNVTKQINSVEGKVTHDKLITISMKIGVRNINQLKMIIDHVKNIHDIYVVQRPFK